MNTLNDLFETGKKFHGHKCPAMPLGLRAALAAMREFGVKHAQNKELYLISETGKGHAAGCFLDGLMVATGCTYGKSNIEKKYYNKMAFTLVEVATGRAIRARLKDDFFGNMLKSPFVKLRKDGVPPQDVPAEIVDPLVDKVLNMSEEMFLEIGEITKVELPKGKGCFETDLCAKCGERTFVNKLVDSPEGKICLACKEKLEK